jgi:predicted CoA-binding protein
MTKKEIVDAFLSETDIAVVGASRNQRKFGSVCYNELKSKGYNAYPVNPNYPDIEGEKCYGNLKMIPANVKAALIVVPPAESGKVVNDAIEAGIKYIWFQQGSHSNVALQLCSEKGLNEVHGECILMFAQPKGVHKFHRWIWKTIRMLPK